LFGILYDIFVLIEPLLLTSCNSELST